MFCTVAQSGRILDVHHRSGNMHDSNGAVDFVRGCMESVRASLPAARTETRMDGTFFSETMVEMLEDLKVEYAISVPFERFAELKRMIESRLWWSRVAGENASGAFRQQWKPKSWRNRARLASDN